MNQQKDSAVSQFYYQGRWVSKNNFRAFIYGKEDQQKLVNSYDEFIKEIESGEWFASKDEVKPKLKAVRKAKDGTNS